MISLENGYKYVWRKILEIENAERHSISTSENYHRWIDTNFYPSVKLRELIVISCP